MIKLHSNNSSGVWTDKFSDSFKEVVSLPVSVDQIVPESSPPRLTSVNESGDGGGLPFQSHHQTVRTAEGAVDKVGEVARVLDGGKDAACQAFFFHQLPRQREVQLRSLVTFYLRPASRLLYSPSENSRLAFSPLYLTTVLSCRNLDTSSETLREEIPLLRLETNGWKILLNILRIRRQLSKDSRQWAGHWTLVLAAPSYLPTCSGQMFQNCTNFFRKK